MNLRGNILILTQWSFKDALVQTYTLPYVNIIRSIIPADKKIIVVTSEQQGMALDEEEKKEVGKKWEMKNMQLVTLPYKKFGYKKLVSAVGQLFKLYQYIKKEEVEVIHAFCTPAAGIGYILSKLTGTVLIVDSYEPHAESMVESGTWKRAGIAYRLLFWLEKKLSGKAKYCIATTAGMKNYAKEKFGVELKNFYVKPACVDFNHFYPRSKDAELVKEFDLDGKLVCVYAGKLGGTYLEDEVFDFVRSCYDFWGNSFRFLMLTGETDKKILTHIRRTHVPENIVIKRFVEHKKIPRYLSLGDFSINPQVPMPSKRYGSPIKDGEYWAMGLPVVISPNISDDSEIISRENIGVVIDFADKSQFSVAIKKLEQLMQDKFELKKKIKEIAIKYRSYTIAEGVYNKIYS